MDNLMHMIHAFQFRNEFWMLILPLILMGIDILTGFVNAWIKKEIKSSKLRSGLGKKIGEISVLVLGEFFSFALRLPKELMQFISLYIILMELISIFENLDKLGVPIPKFIKQVVNNVDISINKTEVKEIASVVEAVKEVESNDSTGNDREGDKLDGKDG